MRVDGFKTRCLIADKHKRVADVAEEADINHGTLRRILRGENVRMDIIGKLARYLGVKTEDIAIRE